LIITYTPFQIPFLIVEIISLKINDWEQLFLEVPQVGISGRQLCGNYPPGYKIKALFKKIIFYGKFNELCGTVQI